MNIKITGIGHYLPEKIETSKELSSKINKSEDWIISRTGVMERRISDVDVDIMGANAARIALDQCGNEPDLILNASGGFTILGQTSSYGAGEYDFWIIKTDKNGIVPSNEP